MTSYRQTLSYLYGLQSRGWKLGLRNTRGLLASAGNPHTAFPSIHIAGTNGKGSTASLLASIFMEAGYRTALYTSPHLVRFTERIRINGKEITERRLVAYAARFRPLIEQYRATFFEATTSIAFAYFAEEQVDVAVVETGLGGRLDATNVLVPMISVITNVSLEHKEYLGDTIPKIAREKAGIVKPGVPLVTAAANKEALRVIARGAERTGSAFYRSQDIVRTETSGDPFHPHLSFRTGRLSVERVRIGLPGAHQVENGRLAVAAVSLLLSDAAFRKRFPRVGQRAVLRGLRDVVKNTRLAGRMAHIGRRYLLDVAHNPEGMKTSVAALLDRYDGGLTVVFGALRDKEYIPMLRELGKVARRIITVTPSTPRALTSETLYRQAMRLGLPAVRGGSVREGLRKAGGEDLVLVTGSHYVVGEAMSCIPSTKNPPSRK